ncbi:MobF family relaxase [Undibacterium sp. MH2W]|uniref:MobF family relaxase n=1 Tax=Undibacterium sp. MH2W TaxID=3413044 RepID=UPI003BEF55A6
MISKSEIKSAVGASKYMTAEAAVEYYAGESSPSAWGGKGAEYAGVSGVVKEADLTNILLGKVREVSEGENGQKEEKIVQLGRTKIDQETGEKSIERRAGVDFTFAPPKSVSIEAEVWGKQDVRDAHEKAVQSSMNYLEANVAQYRVKENGVETTVQSDNLTYATFQHATSRAGDPQTHTHVLIANLTYDANGKARSLSNEKLYDHRMTADAVYKNELASGLQKLGYELAYNDRGEFEIAGYGKEQLEEFSKRSEQIDAALRDRGSNKEQASHEARQIANLATRVEKEAGHIESADPHRERWQHEAKDIGMTQAERKQEMAFESAKSIVSNAIASLSEREQEFSKKDLVKETMLQSSGRVDGKDLLAEIERQKEKGELVQRTNDKSGQRFTTQAAIVGEQWADKQISAGVDAHLNVMSKKEFESALNAFEDRKSREIGNGTEFKLKDEQRNAAYNILTGGDQFNALQGSPGTGKTTMLEFVREAAESKGWTVKGMSNGAAQAETLEKESGIKSQTVAAFLSDYSKTNTEPQGIAKTLYINDEASMSGQKDFNSTIAATQHNGAKIVFAGDKDQHQSVSAGAAFERAISAGKMEVSYLSNITRQKTAEAKAPVQSIIAGNHAEAVRMTGREFSVERDAANKKWGQILETQNNKLTTSQTAQRKEELKQASRQDNFVAIQTLAKDYAALSAEERKQTAVITGTNIDRVAINNQIRNELKKNGSLGEGRAVDTLKAKELTTAQRTQASSYQRGDVLIQSSKRGQVSHLKVKQINANKNTITVEKDGKDVEIKAASAVNMQAYVEQQREFSIGDTIAFTQNAGALKNGTAGTVVKMNDLIMTVDIQGKQKEIDLRSYKHLDHGYVMTSHKSQGATVDRTFVHHNVDSGMHGQRESMVNNTRARLNTVTYTQNVEKASAQAQKEISKTVATKGQKISTARAPQEPQQKRIEGDRSMVQRNEFSDVFKFEQTKYSDYKQQPKNEKSIEKTVEKTAEKVREKAPEKTKEREIDNGMSM